MLINRRNATFGGKSLPYDAEVEYLESTGTQWIDSGIVSENAVSYEVKFKLGAVYTGPVIFGALVQGSATTNNRVMRYNIGNVIIVQRGNYSTSNSVPIDYNWHTVYSSSSQIVIDSTTFRSSSCTNGGATIALFASGDVGTALGQGSFLISYARIWASDVLVRDYIPVRKGNVGYLYDRVSGRLFGNAGTGDFVLGQDVVPVENIDFTGSQYLDFGFKPTQSTTVSMDIIPAATGNINLGWLSAGCGAGVKYECYAWSNKIQFYYGNHSAINWGVYSGEHIKFDLGRIAKYENITQGETHTYTFANTSFTAANNLTVGALNRGSYSYFAKMRLNSMSVSGDRTINCVPVRVGTEGAMMDVLTRRVYRNAGTGAFGYGNDI